MNLRGHQASSTRRLNGHYQSGNRGPDFFVEARTAGYLRGDETGLSGSMFGGNFGIYQRQARVGAGIAATYDQLIMQQIIDRSRKRFYYDYRRYTGTTVPILEECTWYKITIKPDPDYHTHLYFYRYTYPWWRGEWDEGRNQWVYTSRDMLINNFNGYVLKLADNIPNPQQSVLFGSSLCKNMILDKNVLKTAWPNTWIGSPSEKYLTDINQTITGYAVQDNEMSNGFDPADIACIVSQWREVQDVNEDREQPFLNTTVRIETCSYQTVLDNGVFYD